MTYESFGWLNEEEKQPTLVIKWKLSGIPFADGKSEIDTIARLDFKSDDNNGFGYITLVTDSEPGLLWVAWRRFWD